MKSKTEPSLDTPWALGEKKYNLILKALDNRRVEKIVEFGSGTSTVRLAQDYPRAEIVSFEHDRKFQQETTNLLKRFKVSNACIHYRPLKVACFFPRLFLTYSLQENMLPRNLDFSLIDGPVERQTLRGREAVLYLIFPFLRVGALIALDDYHRKSEQAVVRNWLATYKNGLGVIQEYEDLVILEKTAHQLPTRFPGVSVLKDNWSITGILAIRTFHREKRKLNGTLNKWIRK